MGTITGGGNGLQGAGMADTSVNGSSFYKTNLALTHLKKTKRIQNTHRLILNLSIAKIVLLPLLSVAGYHWSLVYENGLLKMCNFQI